MKIRKFKLLLSLLLCLALMPLSVVAASQPIPGADLDFTINSETGILSVTGTGFAAPHIISFLYPDDIALNPANPGVGLIYVFLAPQTGGFTVNSSTPVNLIPGTTYRISASPLLGTGGYWNRLFTGPAINTTNVTGATQGTPFSYFLDGDYGRTTNNTWSLAPGSSLPTGLSLSTDGEIYGTPTVSGPFSFTVRLGGAHIYTERLITMTIADDGTGTVLSNLTLTGITVSPAGAGNLNPAFAAGTVAYTINVANSVASITLTPSFATGATLVSYTAPATLTPGSNNVFTFVVEAEDDTVRIYTITVTRAFPPGGGGFTPPVTPTPAPTPATPTPPVASPPPAATPVPADEPLFTRFTATHAITGADVTLGRLDSDMPEDFVIDMMYRDLLNMLFLLDEMHELGNVPVLVRVYVGDLDLSDEQLVMFVGFEFDMETGHYEIIRGFFGANRSYFYFELDGGGIFGAMLYERPLPLLRFNIGQVRYYHSGLPLESDVAPFISEGRTMVPIRIVAEALGATPRWEDATRTAYIYNDDVVLRLPMGQPLPGGLGIPEMRNDRVLVPVRFVIENFDAITLWNAEIQQVTVYVW